MTTDAATIERLAVYCEAHLPLTQATPPGSYHSLPLCMLDAIFPIGVRYAAAFAVVCRYAEHRRITVEELPALPPIEEQVTTSAFLDDYAHYGGDGMADRILRNRQRTSPRNGILKAAAVERWAKVLAEAGIETMQDAQRAFVSSSGNLPEPVIKEALLAIPGQRSGVSLEYFILLLGDEMRIKPDRRVKRFVDAALGVHVEDNARVIHLLQQASARLAPSYPNLTPRRLDKLIWEQQRAEQVRRSCRDNL
ncbi:MAG: hypothetical protein KDD91_24215 [Caldilinea sp.]|nr:hypothetical protein [Caldilinea sp.]